MARKRKLTEGEALVEKATEGLAELPKLDEMSEPSTTFEVEEVEEVEEEEEDEELAAFSAALKKKWPGQTAVASELHSPNKDSVFRISTGNLALDIATGGGIPRGRITRFWGTPKSAKTGSAFNVVAEYQKHCNQCFERGPCSCLNRKPAHAVWIDAEGRSFDNMTWMAAHGIILKRLTIITPSSGEVCIDSVDAALRKGVGLVVLDSIANVVSSAELNKATEDGEVMGRNAKLVNSALRKWQASMNAAGIKSTKKPTVLLLNQIRNKLDGYGSPDLMPGGKGLDFATSLDIKFNKGHYHYLVNEGSEDDPKWVDKDAGVAGKKEDKMDGNVTPDYAEVTYLISSGNVGGTTRTGKFDYWLKDTHGHHPGDPDNLGLMFHYAKALGLIVKTGASYTFKHLKETSQERLRQAFEKEIDMHRDIWAEIITKTKKL